MRRGILKKRFIHKRVIKSRLLLQSGGIFDKTFHSLKGDQERETAFAVED